MNRYPFWLYVLVLAILLAGCLLALPNIYGSVPAVQIADNAGEPYDEARLDEFRRMRRFAFLYQGDVAHVSGTTDDDAADLLGPRLPG